MVGAALWTGVLRLNKKGNEAPASTANSGSWLLMQCDQLPEAPAVWLCHRNAWIYNQKQVNNLCYLIPAFVTVMRKVIDIDRSIYVDSENLLI